MGLNESHVQSFFLSLYIRVRARARERLNQRFFKNKNLVIINNYKF